MGFPLFQADNFPTLFFCVKCNHLQTITFCTAATVNSVRSSQMHVCVQTQVFTLIFNSSPFQGVHSIVLVCMVVGRGHGPCLALAVMIYDESKHAIINHLSHTQHVSSYRNIYGGQKYTTVTKQYHCKTCQWQ